jgi:hypothetical protein
MNVMTMVAHNTFGRFHDAKQVRACLRQLRRGQISRPHLHLFVQSVRKGHTELPMSLTHARGALFQGAAVGFLGGLIMGSMIVLLDRGAHQIPAGIALLFALFGTLMGGFAGAITGPSSPDRAIEKIEREGDITVAVESDNPSDIDWANVVLSRCGATPQQSTAARMVPSTSS